MQISLFQGNEDEGTKLAEFNQKFPENLGLRDEPENTGDKNEEELVDDVYSFRIDDSLKKYPADEIQEKFELAGKAWKCNAIMYKLVYYFFLLSVGHILVSYKSLGPKVNAVNKMNGDQAEETAPTPALKLPDSEDEHKDEEEVEMESNDEVAKVNFFLIEISGKKTCVKMTDLSFFR